MSLQNYSNTQSIRHKSHTGQARVWPTPWRIINNVWSTGAATYSLQWLLSRKSMSAVTSLMLTSPS